MNQMRTDENYEMPYYQQQTENPCCVSVNFQWLPWAEQTPNPPPRTFEYDRNGLNGTQSLPGTCSDLTGCQLPNPTSSLPQGVAGPSDHSSQKPTEALQKRELRLMKNREAARECRRKKKEYVRCLENRVAVLENQNKTLIEEIRALKKHLSAQS